MLLALGGAVAAPEPAAALEIKDPYYSSYFKTKETCQARGRSLMQTQPDWIAFWCYKKAGHTKWSMRVAVDDGFGRRQVIVNDRTSVRLDPTTGLVPQCG